MKGFLPSDQQPSLTSIPPVSSFRSDSKTSSQSRTPSLEPTKDSIKPVKSHSASSHTHQVSQYLKALRTFNHSHQVENFTISSEFSDQRQTALFLCGPDYNSNKIEEVVTKYELIGMYGKACAVALFSGNTQRAITSLQRSDVHLIRFAVTNFGSTPCDAP